MVNIFLFVVHLLFSFYFLGLIWFVQLVHYPMFLFLKIEPELNPFIFHQTRSGSVIIPAMVFELASAIGLMFWPFPNYFVALTLLVLTALCWLATFTIQVPCHKSLKKEKANQLSKS